MLKLLTLMIVTSTFMITAIKLVYTVLRDIIKLVLNKRSRKARPLRKWSIEARAHERARAEDAVIVS